MRTILFKEGKTEFYIPDPKYYPLSARSPAFFNPAMITNRDLTVAFCKALKVRSALDLLTGTGAKGLRLAVEAGVAVWFNDRAQSAFKLIVRNAIHNKIEAQISQEDANVLLNTLARRFDLIDIDPFGPPIEFLDSAIRAKPKYLSVTATDTAALAGTYPNACIRKYGAKPLRVEMMHEIGLRILIKKVQEIAAQYELAANPLLSYYERHYLRAFFNFKAGARVTDRILKQHKYLQYCHSCCWREVVDFPCSSKCPNCGGALDWAGPLWCGPLWDSSLISRLTKIASKMGLAERTRTLLSLLSAELQLVGFYDAHLLAKKLRLKSVPKLEQIIKLCKGSRTHFSPTGFKCKSYPSMLKTARN